MYDVIKLGKDLIRNTIITIVGIVVILLLVNGGQWFYSTIDQDTFPIGYQFEPTEDETLKAGILLNSITNQMTFELDSTFGWTVNDVLFNSYILDNRAYRQLGVYNATKSLIDIYTLTIARLGNNDKEDPDLHTARQNYFSLNPTSWGFMGLIASAEGYYSKGLEQLSVYEDKLSRGEAKYNMKTDDVYEVFNLIVSDRILGYALGLLETSDTTNFYTLDNNIYEAQGIVLVVRDFINTLYHLYPIDEKNNKDNFEHAIKYLNLVASFDPIWISTKPFNSGALIRSHILNAKNRLEDIRNSIKI